jgi:hypothetical protein
MPFAPALNYFFLHLKEHIEQKHGLVCYRADEKFSTKPVREKISDYIADAEVVIADCTGNNPNVLYELGIAHALGKDVILITQDSMEKVPSDIRHFEFIKNDVSPTEFAGRLDNAVNEILVARYERLYEAASRVFADYQREANPSAQRVPREQFVEGMKTAVRWNIIPKANEAGFPAFVLPAITEGSAEASVMESITDWLIKTT